MFLDSKQVFPPCTNQSCVHLFCYFDPNKNTSNVVNYIVVLGLRDDDLLEKGIKGH